MRVLASALLAALLLVPPSASAQTDALGSLGLGGGAFFAEATPGLFDDDGGAVLPFASAQIRVVQSPVLVGFYLDLQAVQVSSVRDELLLSDDAAGETAYAMNVGATLPLQLGDDSALYALGGFRLADGGFGLTGGEVGGGVWLGLGDRVALNAEGGYLFVDEDASVGGVSYGADGVVFARAGLGIRIQD